MRKRHIISGVVTGAKYPASSDGSIFIDKAVVLEGLEKK